MACYRPWGIDHLPMICIVAFDPAVALRALTALAIICASYALLASIRISGLDRPCSSVSCIMAGKLSTDISILSGVPEKRIISDNVSARVM